MLFYALNQSKWLYNDQHCVRGEGGNIFLAASVHIINNYSPVQPRQYVCQKVYAYYFHDCPYGKYFKNINHILPMLWKTVTNRSDLWEKLCSQFSSVSRNLVSREIHDHNRPAHAHMMRVSDIGSEISQQL